MGGAFGNLGRLLPDSGGGDVSGESGVSMAGTAVGVPVATQCDRPRGFNRLRHPQGAIGEKHGIFVGGEAGPECVALWQSGIGQVVVGEGVAVGVWRSRVAAGGGGEG